MGGKREAMMASIDVSAQFGGRDAAKAILPHLRALKSAHKGMSFEGFHFSQVAFILRVDGEVSAYHLSGAGDVECDRSGRYVSVDIGLAREDWVGRGAAEVSAFVISAIMSSVDVLRRIDDPRLAVTDWTSLENALKAFTAAY